MQVKSNLEKAKQALEKESSELSVEVRSLVQAKQELEHKKKKVEGQLTDLQSRFNDSERQKAELGDRVSKITVSAPQVHTGRREVPLSLTKSKQY